MNKHFYIKIKDFLKHNCKIVIGIMILIFMSLYIISIYNNVVKYSINTLDDFIHYCTYTVLYQDREFDLFDFATKYAVWDCVNVGGRYFTMFIQILLGPNPYTDIIAKNRLVMIANMILYFTSFYLMIFTMISKLIIKSSKILNKIFLSLVIFTIFLVLHNSYQFYTEIFTWFSGAASYSFPLSFLFLSLALFVVYIESLGKYKYFLVLPIIITSMCALGGSISIVCIAFVFVLSLLIYTIINKKLNIVSICLFFHFLCFALLNVTSPGNYLRLSRTLNETITHTSELFDPERITIVLNTTNKYIIDRYICLFNKYCFVLILLLVTSIIAFLISKYARDINYGKVLYTILPFSIMPYLASLSFAVGYQDKILMYDRCYFIIDFCIIFTLLMYLIFIFVLVFNLFWINNRILLCELVMALIIVLNMFILGNSKEEDIEKNDINRIELITVAVDNANGKYKEYNNKCAELINVLQTSSGKESVKVKYISHDEAPKYIMEFYDGKHMPWILPDENYLPRFYDIKQIIILDK